LNFVALLDKKMAVRFCSNHVTIGAEFQPSNCPPANCIYGAWRVSRWTLP